MVTLASLLMAVSIQLCAQTANENADLTKLLKTNSYVLVLNDGRLSGEGADFLFREAAKAQFFLIGEEHGTAENPLFAAVVLRELDRYRYRYFASEIGKLTATKLETPARQNGVRKVLTQFNRQISLFASLLQLAEEGILLDTALRLPRGKLATWWGLDQEFFFSPIYHFERLLEPAPNAKARAVVSRYYEQTHTELSRSIEAHNPGLAFIVSATAADFDRLDRVFSNRDREAKQILRVLRESWEIYQKNARGEVYANNLQRALLLKRNFMSYYKAAEKIEGQPKVFFKFGAAHVFRGRNYVNVFDLGNMVSELAESHGPTSFHVLILAAGGTYNRFLPFIGNDADKRKRFDPAEVYFYFDVTSFTGIAESSSWQVINLRPLRPLLRTKELSKLPRGVDEIILGFDAVVLVQQAHPATLFE